MTLLLPSIPSPPGNKKKHLTHEAAWPKPPMVTGLRITLCLWQEELAL